VIGVVYVALGKNAQAEAKQSALSLLKHNKYTIKTLEKPLQCSINMTQEQQAHWAKVNAYWWSPFDLTLMLDADTRVNESLSLGFQILRAGWDVVMVPSVPIRPNAVLWNLSGEEKDITLEELGTWRHVMLNTGVFYFKKTPMTLKLFETWRKEWLRFKDRDQGAFLRALNRNPVKLWLLGYPFNSAHGEVVDHLFGRAR